MPVSEQLTDDQRNEWSGEIQAGLDDETINDRAAATIANGQASLRWSLPLVM